MIQVQHQRGSYEVRLAPLHDVAEDLPGNAVIITDDTVASLYPAFLESRPHFAIPAGEESKNLDVYGKVIAWLAELPANRKTSLVAFGGGVVGDLAGFAAASYMRGISLVQVPTTLLAMVDSSVGGKVGVDLSQGKNLVGAFLAPQAVHVPIEVLATQPTRQFRNGMAEVVKYGFIMDACLAEELGSGPLDSQTPHLDDLVMRCIQHKADVVAEDEFETTGRRAILNFGHTIGHAIEQVTGYGPILHGEAISIGMVMEAELAERLGLASKGLAGEVARILSVQGLPTRQETPLDPQQLVIAMRRDKKSTGEGLAFSLVTSVGSCKLYTGVPERDVLALLSER